MKTYPNKKTICKYFYHDNDCGFLRNKLTRSSHAVIDNRAGKYAARYDQVLAGYRHRKISLHNIRYYEHCLIWSMYNGDIPSGYEIDHINGISDDNRIENLRIVTRKENTRNARIRNDNSSGVTGISLIGKKYLVRINNTKGETITIGRFSFKEEAIAARKEAEKKYGYHPNHGRS